MNKTKSIPIDKVKILKELGHGIMGTVYLVSYKKKNYALKIEHILEEDVKDKTSPVWNEIYFAKKLANKYPEQFMSLLGYDFIDNCDLKQEYPVDISIFPESKQNFLKKIASSPFCVRKIYSLVDTTLDKIKIKSLEERYSMIIQLLHIIHLMHSKNYVHADFHPGNVGVIKTKKKFINIMGHKIPTYGRIFQAIDYGGVLNKNTMDPKRPIMNLGPEATQKIIYDWAFKLGDIMPILLNNVVHEEFSKYLNKNNIQTDFQKDKKNILKLPEMEIVKNLLKTQEEDLYFEIFLILFPRQAQQAILGNKFDNKERPPKILIPMEDILIFAVYFNDLELLLDYFISKIGA